MKKYKFNHCYTTESGVTWCQHHNGNWAPPFFFNKKKENPSSQNDEGLFL